MFAKGRSVIVEILSIVLGVLLALGVSEWNEDRVNRNIPDDPEPDDNIRACSAL